jgi:hypothetical protein
MQNRNRALRLAEPHRFLKVPCWIVGDLVANSIEKAGACLKNYVVSHLQPAAFRALVSPTLKA